MKCRLAFIFEMSIYGRTILNISIKFYIFGFLYFWINMFRYWLREVLPQIVNFGSNAVNLTISASGLEASVNSARSTVTVLTSSNPLDGNSFSQPKKVRWRQIQTCFLFSYLNPSASSYNICILQMGAGGAGYQQATQCCRGDAILAGSLLLYFIWSSSRSLDH
jgi:hypothetical protein